MRSFRACAAATGVAQMPQVELPGGSWLTDSVRIIDHFEDSVQAPMLAEATSLAVLLLGWFSVPRAARA